MTTETIPAPAGVLIADAIYRAIHPAGRMTNYGETQWTARTDSGAQHNYAIRFDDADAAHRLIDFLDADTLRVPGHLVVETDYDWPVNDGDGVTVQVRVLTLAIGK
jgi:hypothetical protein